jgi:RNA polymerase sigma-70 factor (ECF subfamily)
MEVNELSLLERITTGDASAFEAFYKLYYPRLFRFVLRTTRLPEYVEEVIQETLLLIWQQPEQFNHSCKISTWVFGIAYNKSLNVVSKHNKRGGDIDIDELAEVLGDPLANLAQTAETEDWLNRALDTLPAEQRAVIELTFYDGLPYQEIAKVLDCPENTVKTRMFHARKKLHAFAATMEN